MKKYILLTFLLAIFGIKDSISQVDVSIKNLNINTKNSDFSAAIYQKNKLVYASAKKLNKLIKRTWKPNSQPYLNLYIGEVTNKKDSLKEVVSISRKVNSRYHESSVVFTKDGKTMYFTRNNFKKGRLGEPDVDKKVVLQLFKAEKIKGRWSNIKSLPFNSNYYSTGHPALSVDNKKLYFVSDMPGSIGATDIFVVDIISNEEYSEPKNLGKKINSTGKEMFPFIDENNTLYFSSDTQKVNYGNLDIYASEFKNKTYSEPKNIGFPFNSISDDFAFIKAINQKEGYFSSNRYGGKGGDDIYAFNGFPELFKKDCFESIKGVVLDKQTNLPISNVTVSYVDSLFRFKKETSNNGIFTFKRKCSKNYGVVKTINKTYKQVSKVVTINNKNDLTIYLDKDFIKDDKIKRVNNNLLIVIGEIYFDSNKSNIRLDASLKLNNLVTIMNQYPSIKVEIGSHTDSRGNAKYNMNLSIRRSNAVLEYIISQGIPKTRIFSKGYGETALTNNCASNVKCSKEAHQMNRRTEFKIIENK